MSDPLTGQPALAEPGERGRLVIGDHVVETIAKRAAVEIPSVRRVSSPLNPLSRSLPRAEVTHTATHARITVHLATGYDRPLYAVASEVRDHVATTVTRLTGMTVDIVNVEIDTVASSSAPSADDRTTLARKDRS